jgi:hypothetical protein
LRRLTQHTRHTLAAATLCFIVTLAVCCGLWWPVPLHLDTLRPLTAFGDSHIWVMEALRNQLVGAEPSEHICGPGYPHERTLRALAWVPTLIYTLLRTVLQPLAAANVVQLISLPASSLAAMALIQRWTHTSPWTAAALGAVYGLCPTLLATLGVGEISNTQAWILPLFLLAMHRAMRTWPGVLAVAVVGLSATFTSPYYALALPLMAGAMVLGDLWTKRRFSVRALVPVAVLAAVQAPALWYYASASAGGQSSMFRPAKRGQDFPELIAKPPPVSQLDQLIVDTFQDAHFELRPLHVGSVGVALALVALFALYRRNPGWQRGTMLMVGGLILSLGPALYVSGHLVTIGETPLYLPVQLLEMLGWPTKAGGMYYRYAVLAVLGCTVLAGTALQRWKWAPLLAWAVLALQVGQGIWETGPRWPRPSQKVVARAEMEALQGPDMGAVLELPFQTAVDANLGQSALLRAVFHGQPTTALPRGNPRPDSALKALLKPALSAKTPDEAMRKLRIAGVSAVVLDVRAQKGRVPSMHTLVNRLGPPTQVGHLMIWTAGPSQARCLAAPRTLPKSQKAGKAPPRRKDAKAPPPG